MIAMIVKKFINGIRTDARGTIFKAILYSLRIAGDAIADGLYFIFITPLLLFPSRTQARIKHKLSPTVRLDYPRDIIKMQADSLLDLFRARACEKEPETVEWIEGYIKTGDVFFDIGANVGAYSLIACKYLHGNVIVHAFEPSFSNYYQLCRNILQNECQDTIIPHMIALSQASEPVIFHYRSIEIGSSLHVLGDNPAQMADQPARFVYSQQVLGFRIDDLISNFNLPVPNHIKLDVDGGELSVLFGAVETIQNPALKSIFMEVDDERNQTSVIVDLLMSSGFHLVSKTDRGGGLIWNYIFKRQ